jgi:hypothetical protein
MKKAIKPGQHIAIIIDYGLRGEEVAPAEVVSVLANGDIQARIVFQPNHTQQHGVKQHDLCTIILCDDGHYHLFEVIN